MVAKVDTSLRSEEPVVTEVGNRDRSVEEDLMHADSVGLELLCRFTEGNACVGAFSKGCKAGANVDTRMEICKNSTDTE